jgi:Mg-chelatase subunit ChlI
MTSAAQKLKQSLSAGVSQAIYGLEPTIHGLTIALIAKGQVLLEGVPGLGKTLLAKTLAQLLGGTFKRIQCTADMMPSDLTGIHVYNADKRSFDLIPGPLFADVVLVDEINRTGPKTQSAFLQAMEEGAITIDRETYPLAREFFIMASQNPHEFEGTFSQYPESLRPSGRRPRSATRHRNPAQGTDRAGTRPDGRGICIRCCVRLCDTNRSGDAFTSSDQSRPVTARRAGIDALCAR